MTTLIEQLDALPRARSRPHRTPLLAALAVVVVANAVVIGSQAVRLRTQVGRERSALEAARLVETIAQRSIDAVHHATASALAARSETVARDRQQLQERALAYTALVRIAGDLASTNQALTSVQAAQTVVAQYSAERDSCISGLRVATSALQQADPAGAVAALRNAAAACSAALAAATGARFPYDFPDPSVLAVGSRFYAYSTNSGAGNIQVLVSSDLVRWSIVGDGLAGLPGWASPGATWAPSVMALGSGYLAYYTVRDIGSGLECVTVAASTSPAGPFVDTSKAPLVCQAGGSIDPSPFVDATGTAWLLWKSEATATTPATIWSQPLNADGLTFQAATTPTPLLSPDQSWEHGVVEAPSMIQIRGVDYLFYSGALWTTAGYAEGVSVCAGPAGPCHRTVSGPVLASAGLLAGPGGGDAFTTPAGTVWLAFHAYTQPDVGYPNSRTLHFAAVTIVNGVVVVTPQ